MIVHTIPQRTPEWHQLRAGRLTGSRAADALAKTKSGEAYKRRDLRYQLICERLTGRAQESTYVNEAMQRGIDCEPLALAAYEAITGQLVQTTGFCQHDTLMAGCSLDGHVGEFETLVSLKCPKSATHLQYLRDGVFPRDYVPQMLHELWITGAKFYDFLSWDDRFPQELQTFYIRVRRDEKAVAQYADEARAFLEEVENEHQAILTMGDLKGTLERAMA